jgi:hypothetical protein
MQVVNANSAKIGDGKEEVGSIPANHSNMTKFEGLNDVGFKRVSAQLRRWLELVRSHNSEYNTLHVSRQGLHAVASFVAKSSWQASLRKIEKVSLGITALGRLHL